MNRRPSWAVSFFKALLFHAVLAVVLFLRLGDVPSRPQPVETKPAEVVQAVAVNETEVEAELQRLKAEEESKRLEEEARQRELEQARLREEQKLVELKRSRGQAA